MPGLQLLDEVLHVSRTSCCAVAGFRFLLSEAGLLALMLVETLLAVDALLLLLLP